jgi:phosphoglycolate phosphatase
MKIKNILFDLDGTVINSKIGVTGSIQYALRELGVDRIPKQENLVWCIGPPLQRSFSILLQTEDKAKIDEAIRAYRYNYNHEGIYLFKLYEGIVSTIRVLKKEGFNVYIATSKPQVMAIKIIEHASLSELFDGIYGPEFDGSRIGKGELISYLLEKEKISAGETIMVGDRKYDILGAKENGIVSCGVKYGFGEKEELLNAGADFIIQEPKEILDIVR